MFRHTSISTEWHSSTPSRTKRFGTAAASLAISAALALTLTAAPMALAVENGESTQAQPDVTAVESAETANALRAPQSATMSRAPQAGASPATVLVYMNGSDLESQAGEATADIAEMLESGIGENANVIIETLGTSQWQRFGIASDHTQRYAVEKGELKLVDDSLGQLDTTSPDTLADFIRWGVENYPADRYILLLWNHGAGPVYGFGYDEFQSDYSALTLDEMKRALEANSDVHFDIIGMDCCIMSSLETCYALEPFCDYTVLSEDFEPGSGWSYTNWMSALENDPEINTEELGSIITNDMVKDAENYEMADATLALIDESKIPALYQAWVDFAYANKDSLLESNYSQEAEWKRGEAEGDSAVASPRSEKAPGNAGDYDLWDNVFSWGDSGGWGNSDSWGDSGGWGDSGSWGSSDEWGSLDDWANLWDYWNSDASYVTMTDYFVTDILQVASSIDSDKADTLKAAVNDAIVHFSATGGETGMTGLSVTLPYGDAEFYDQLVQVFKASGIDSSYVDWLEAFVDAPGANNYYDYGNATLDDSADAHALDNNSSNGYDDAYGYGNSNGYDHGYGNGYSDNDAYGYGIGNDYGYGYDNGNVYDEGYGNGYGHGTNNGNDYDYDDAYGYEPGQNGGDWPYSYDPPESLPGQLAA